MNLRRDIQYGKWKTTEEAAMTAGQQAVAITAEGIQRGIFQKTEDSLTVIHTDLAMRATMEMPQRLRNAGRGSSEARTGR